MLLRPPSINQQGADNLSRVITESQAQQSSRSKNKIKKKQNSLSFRNRPINSGRQNQQKQRENDVGSVHSHASGRSKKSKKKQSSIGGNKPRGGYITANSPRKSDPQDIEVLDYAQLNEKTNRNNKIYDFQQPEVKQDYQPKTAYNYSPVTQNRSPNLHSKNSFSNAINNMNNVQSFGHREEIQDQIPVVKLVENRDKTTPYLNYHNPINSVSPKVAERRQTRKLGQLFEQNRRNTQNSSQLAISAVPSEINNSGVGGQSRRSRSKLGQLFKQKSRQKQMNNNSRVSFTQNSSDNFQYSVSDSNLHLQSNLKGPAPTPKIHAVGNRSRQKMSVSKSNIPQKVLEESVRHFEPEDINKSELNLSMSRNSPAQSKMPNQCGNEANNKDSVCFNLQPERERRKKGLGLASKMMKNDDQMIKISGNLYSKQIEQTSFQKSQISGTNQLPSIPSKQQAAHQKLKMNLKQNEKYLAESGISNINNLQETKLQKYEQEIKQKQLELQRQKAAIQEKNKLQRIRLQEDRQLQRRRQQQIRNQQQNLRKEEERRRVEYQRKQEERRKQDERRQEQRRRQYEKKQRIRQEQMELQKKRLHQAQKQLQQQRLKQRQQQKKRQNERKLQEIQIKKQKEQAIKQKQRLKQAYQKQKQKIKKNHDDTEKQKSLIYELQSEEVDTNQKISSKQIIGRTTLENIPSTYSRDHSSKDSERSKDSRKSTRKKQGVIARNTNKHLLAEVSPRAQESFYEENTQKQQKQIQNSRKVDPKSETVQIPRKLMSFTESEDANFQVKNEYKTDSYFYDKSSKAHSRPPLSKKSSSKSKPKQSSINKKPKDSQIKINNQQSKQGQKKMSLVELAMKKNYEPDSGSQYHSQDSFRSRQNSVNSSGSRKSMNSKGSKKKESIVRIKQNNLSGNRPPLYRKTSSENEESIINRTERHEREVIQRQRYAEIQRKKQEKPTVIKGCSFIDEKGRLVQNGNMIVKGSQVSGFSGKNEFTQQRFVQRLMNSREKRRSKSRQRSLNRSRASSRSIQKTDSRYDKGTKNEFIQSQAYSETEYSHADRRFESGSNFYSNNKAEQSYYKNYTGSIANNYNSGSNYKAIPQTLQQFVKPIEEAGIHKHKQIIHNHNQHQKAQVQQAQVTKKRSMQRTQRM